MSVKYRVDMVSLGDIVYSDTQGGCVYYYIYSKECGVNNCLGWWDGGTFNKWIMKTRLLRSPIHARLPHNFEELYTDIFRNRSNN